jgi:hypothetical protein
MGWAQVKIVAGEKAAFLAEGILEAGWVAAA